MKATVISFINMKGGVGKTTLTINVGKKLSDLGHKVLIVDMDPQFNATQSLLLYKTQYSCGNLEDDNEEHIFEQEMKSSEFYKLLSDRKETVLQMFESSCITEEPTSTIKQIVKNLYLIPGDLRLLKEVSGDNTNKFSTVTKYFKKNNILDEFEYILIDCSPTWSILTHSSLFASDYYVIPSKIDLYSSIGINLLEEQINKKIREEEYVSKEKEIRRLGIIFTLVNRNIRTEEKIRNNLKNDFSDIEFFENDFPYIPSASTRFIMIDEVKHNSIYSELVNSVEKITEELKTKLQEMEVNSSV
ncbi:ParA family protein [Clostridioides difficile]|uniref:ParA family protein n=1 Tax=Clostridioides difficile TaxID=1496 RepID=UPI001C1BC14D|nr:ParA family protein [Clostridioides difficile]HBE9816197.1 AAA family ATPase [Clostridioides difficile]HBF3596718.1 AAA family ATPase [Clostridioides difficile]HBG3423607.1 AAA family ATPase [Clostridioides difficile]HBG4039776.1 AAA family ATPase [Clostridioides difficile]